MSDLISRQAAIDALAKAMPSLTTPDGCGEFDHEIQIAQEAFVDAMQIIHELPSVTLQPNTGHWIPCSERLPENKTYVLTTIKVPNRIAHTRSGWYEGGFFHNDNGDVWRATDMEVVAWMPLPEKYKAETEGEE